MRGWIAIAFLVAACGKGGDKAKPAPATSDAAIVAKVAPDAAPPAPPDAEVSLTGVPPLTLTRPPGADPKKAQDLNAQALVKHKAGKKDPAPLAEAIALYEQALVADPTHLLARYNLASALSTGKQFDRALAILAEFRDVGCATCLERLSRARNDAEWKPLWGDPRFVEITKPPGDGPPARVILVGVVPGCDHDDESGHGLAIEVLVDPAPGFARLPALELELSKGGKSIEQRTPEEMGYDRAGRCTTFKDPGGTVEVTLTTDGRKFGTLTVEPGERDVDSYAYLLGTKREVKIARCDQLECPEFPALSPDGKVFAVREGAELYTPGEICNPPVDNRTSYFKISGEHAKEIGSVDLSGFEVMDCQSDKLLDGFVLEHVYDEPETFLIKDPKGKIVAGMKPYNPIGACVSTQHRVVLVDDYEGVGGDCDETGDHMYTVLHY